MVPSPLAPRAKSLTAALPPPLQATANALEEAEAIPPKIRSASSPRRIKAEVKIGSVSFRTKSTDLDRAAKKKMKKLRSSSNRAVVPTDSNSYKSS